MIKNKELDLSVASYGDTKDVAYEMALLPWGATEPHNYHLPYLTDAILSHDIAVEAAYMAKECYGLNVMVLPPVFLGSQNPGQRSLKFCIHSRQKTQKAILWDIVSSLYSQGVRRLIIINGHGGNTFKGFIRDLALDFPDMLAGVSEWYKLLPAKDYFEEPGDHADELETSVMMYYHPELVDLPKAGEGKAGGFKVDKFSAGKVWIPRNWLKISRDTGVGSPYKATSLKGERFAKDIAQEYAGLFREFCKPEDEIYSDL